jgi:hypothetical protein
LEAAVAVGVGVVAAAAVGMGVGFNHEAVVCWGVGDSVGVELKLEALVGAGVRVEL